MPIQRPPPQARLQEPFRVEAFAVNVGDLELRAFDAGGVAVDVEPTARARWAAR